MTYSKVVHNPPFMKSKGVHTSLRKMSLQSLHDVGFAHCDIRSDNICINTDYQLVPIDLDRVTPSTYQVPEKTYGESCMYEIPCSTSLEDWTVVKMDFVQLGYMLAFAVNENHIADYHGMCFEDLCQEIKDDVFLQKLILEGQVDEDALESSILSAGKTTIETVIKSRILN